MSHSSGRVLIFNRNVRCKVKNKHYLRVFVLSEVLSNLADRRGEVHSQIDALPVREADLQVSHRRGRVQAWQVHHLGSGSARRGGRCICNSSRRSWWWRARELARVSGVLVAENVP